MSKLCSLSILVILCYFIAPASFLIIPPEANMSFIDYMKKLNYPVEQHFITTQDGYILTYYRIQAKNTAIKGGLPVVYIHHGLLDTSDSAVFNAEDQSIGLILANNGYDVWLANDRGNKYSLQHIDPVHYNPNDPNSAFWDFTWQEITEYDLPAAFNYIGLATGQVVNYVGHSQGTTIMFAALARQDPTVLKYLGKYIALAPSAFLQHSTSQLVTIAAMIKAGTIAKAWGFLVKDKTFGFRSPLKIKSQEVLCAVAPSVCIEQIKLSSDADPSVLNLKKLVVLMGHFPAGTSVQNILYWQQMFNQDTFNMFDYGKEKNLLVYGTPTPPAYDLSKITVPIYMFAGENDELASIRDNVHLKDQFTGSSYVQFNTYPDLGHFSFVFGKDVAAYFQDVLKVLAS